MARYTWVYGITFSTICSILIGTVALFVASFAYDTLLTMPKFRAKTQFEKIFNAMDPEIFHSTYPTPCTNKTLGDDERIYDGLTEIAHTCGQSEIPCTEFYCGSDGYCKLKKASDADCIFDSECPGFSPSCSMCQCQELPLCNGTYGCDQPDWNQCLISVCDGGFECMTVKDPLVECADANDCGLSEDCINCSCIARNVTEVICATPLNNCVVMQNNMGNCTEVLIPGAESASDPECVLLHTEGWFLNQSTCQCYQQSGTFVTQTIEAMNLTWDAGFSGDVPVQFTQTGNMVMLTSFLRYSQVFGVTSFPSFTLPPQYTCPFQPQPPLLTSVSSIPQICRNNGGFATCFYFVECVTGTVYITVGNGINGFIGDSRIEAFTIVYPLY